MNQSEVLLQRFVDDELSREERVALFEALDRDSVLRRRLLEMEMLVAEARRLPRMVPRPSFAAGVLARIPSPRPSVPERLRSFLWTPHVAEWNVAGAVVTACLLIVLSWSLGRLTSLPPVPIPVADDTREEPMVMVRLVLVQPEAAAVAVAGDFNGWNPARTPLMRAASGAWTATITLKPGRYQYMFVVDGKQWVTDPLASDVNADGFGQRNAVLEIEAPI